MKKILIIEDNTMVSENTAAVLELASYKVYTAECGKTGVEIAVREKPDLIICDVQMPVLDGFGVLHLLSKNPVTQNIPFIFLTAKADRTDMRKGMEMGADDYIIKPYTEIELLQAVESRLKRINLFRQDLAADGSERNGFTQHVDQKALLQAFTENRNISIYKKKHVIYAEGNRPSRLFYIQKGSVRTYRTNEDGKELVVGLYKEGDFLGYVALAEGTSYKEVAEAMEYTELAIIPRGDFEETMNTSSEMARTFMELLARNITENDARLLDMAYNSLRKKVANTLIALNKKYKSYISNTRQNLATIAGTATESLIRTLVDFKNEQLIDINGCNITILNEKRLENMVN